MDENQRKRLGYQCTIAAMFVSLFAGSHNAWSVVSKEIVAQYGWTASQATLPFSVMTIVTGLMPTLAGFICEKKSPKLSVALGGFGLAAGLCLCGMTHNPLLIALFYGCLVALPSGLLPCTLNLTPAKWFPEKKGFMIGVTQIFFGLSSMIYSPLFNYLLRNYGVSFTLISVGIGGGLAICIGALFMHNPQPYVEHISKMKAEGKIAETTEVKTAKVYDVAGKDYTLSEAMKMSAYWKLFLIFMGTHFANLMVGSHMANIASVQAGWQAGFILVVISSCCTAFGRFTWSRLADKIGIYNVHILCFGLQAVNMLAFGFYRTPAMLVLGAMIVGITNAGAPLLTLGTSVEFGIRNLNSVYGPLNISYCIAGFFGPMIAAKCVDMTGTYQLSFYVAFAFIAFLMFPCIISLKRNDLKRRKALGL